MKRKLVIGLCGPMGAGKTTAAQMLMQMAAAENISAARIAFATPLKNMLAAAGVPGKHLYGTPAEKAEPLDMLCGKSAREAMQRLGAEWGRDMIGEDLWVRLWIDAVGRSTAEIVIADDMRFANEAAAIQSFGGARARIVPTLHARPDAGVHVSEQWDKLPIDYVVPNDGSQAELQSKLKTRFEHMLRKAGFVETAGA